MNKRVVTTICIFITLAIILGILGVGYLYNCEEEQPEPTSSIIIDGVEYNERLQTVFLFVGVDEDDTIKSSNSYVNTEQADFVALITLDSIKQEYTVLQLNRDSMVKIDQMGVKGDFTGSTYLGQLALAYTYGTGLEDSCRYMCKTISRMFYGLTVDYYAVMSMGGIKILNDFLSNDNGIPVTFDKDYLEFDASYTSGATVNLSGEKALSFIRSRMDVEDGQNISRMNRQRTYISSFVSFIKTLEITDVLVSNGYSKLVSDSGKYLISNAQSATYSKMFEGFKNFKDNGIKTIDGTVDYSHEYVEFHLNEESLKQTAIEMFFDKK